MIKKITQLLLKIGIDGAIIYTILGRLIQSGGGVASILFVAKYLSDVEQGYYYTFGSILAIQIFFELGLSSIITQFVAHEKAHLNWEGKTVLIGDEKSLSRLASLLRFCVKWFVIIAVFLFITLIIAGYLFFNHYGKTDSGVEWMLPWIILSTTASANLILSPILAFIEGLNKIKDVAKIRLFQSILQLAAMFIFLVLGFKLFSSPLAAVIVLIVPPLWILFSYKKELLLNIWYGLRKWKVDYRLEIFPYQWRIALSWMSGYFIFQLFNPVIFATEGANVAGKMGMTLAVMSGILSLSLSWISTKTPVFSGLIAKKNYEELDILFKKATINSSIITIFCMCIFIFGLYCMELLNMPLRERFLSLPQTFLLSISTFANQLVSALATYIRCHKQEPFLIFSIIIGVLTALSTLILGKIFGIDGILYGYMFITAGISLVWAFKIFLNKKKEWHVYK